MDQGPETAPEAETAATSDPAPAGRAARVVPRALVAAAFVGLAVWSWRRWPDPLVDFGRELYLPWRVASGDVLYRDVAHFNGPLSVHFNAALFGVFGASLTVLALANLAILAGLTAALYGFFRRCAGELAGAAAALVLLGCFGFAHLSETGNYNWVCPYSHELTHGVALGVLVVALVARGARPLAGWRKVAAGACLGLVFLTKSEAFVAALAGAVVGLGLDLLAVERPGRARAFGALAGVALGFAATLGVAFGLLMLSRPAGEAARALGQAWLALLTTNVSSEPFYRRSLGVDEPLANGLTLLRAALAVLLITSAVVLRDVARGRAGRASLRLSLAAAAALAGGLLLRGFEQPWVLVGEGLPALVGLALVAHLVACLRARGEPSALAEHAPLAVWAAFALALLAKIALRSRLYQYGFALAMPAAVLVAVEVVAILPRALERRGRGGKLTRVCMTALVVLDIAFCLKSSHASYRDRVLPVGPGADSIVAFDRRTDCTGAGLELALERVAKLAPGARFVVLPEGIILNYWARVPSGSPYVNFMPPELAIFGEETILASLKGASPELVLRHRPRGRRVRSAPVRPGPALRQADPRLGARRLRAGRPDRDPRAASTGSTRGSRRSRTDREPLRGHVLSASMTRRRDEGVGVTVTLELSPEPPRP